MTTRYNFANELTGAVPESNELLAEHLADHGEPLLLMSDLLRLTVSTFSQERTGVTDRLLEFVDCCLREGDDDVIHAVGVSFDEDFGTYPGESDALLPRWPPSLRAELDRLGNVQTQRR